MVGSGGGPRSLARLTPALDYLRAHPEVRDVIISGGDPLALGTRRLVELVSAVRSVPSVETIRLATRVPVVLPKRIDAELLTALQAVSSPLGHDPLQSPAWLAPEATARPRTPRGLRLPGDEPDRPLGRRQRRSGPSWRSSSAVWSRRRARPYYLLQMDPVSGSGHLHSDPRGLDIMEALQGRLSGIALPKLIVDTPGGFGKVPLSPSYVVSSR